MLTLYFADNAKHSNGGPLCTGATAWPAQEVLVRVGEAEADVADGVSVALLIKSVAADVE